MLPQRVVIANVLFPMLLSNNFLYYFYLSNYFPSLCVLLCPRIFLRRDSLFAGIPCWYLSPLGWHNCFLECGNFSKSQFHHGRPYPGKILPEESPYGDRLFPTTDHGWTLSAGAVVTRKESLKSFVRGFQVSNLRQAFLRLEISRREHTRGIDYFRSD